MKTEESEEEMATVYRIKIVRGDNCVEAEGDKAFVLEMLKRFDAAGEVHPKVEKLPTNKLHDGPKHSAERAQKGISVGEFVRQLGIKKHTDYVLAFGYYLEKHGGQASFTPADINEAYYDAKLDVSNTSQMIIYNIKRGYFMNAKGKKDSAGENDGKKRYTVTRSGEEQIEQLMSSRMTK